MQYESYKKHNNTSLYIIIAICVVAIGLISYLAVIKNNEKNAKDDNSSEKSELSSDTSSYNSTKDEIIDDNNGKTESQESQTTKNDVSSVPYEEKQTFVMPIKGNIIKGYSETSLQYDKTYGDMRIHKGIDIGCEENAKVVSASKGTVTDISESPAFGTVITIDHGNGLSVKYCGMGSVCVTKGEEVATGDLIGTQKNPSCECMDDNHIHIECSLNGSDVSPVNAFGFN